jgi:hypothetical protein
LLASGQLHTVLLDILYTVAIFAEAAAAPPGLRSL